MYHSHIIPSFCNKRRGFEELLSQHFTTKLSNQFDIIPHSRPNFMYVKTIWFRRGIILGGQNYRVERERESPNYPANTLLTYFINSESLSILPLSESKNETLDKYSYVILLFICLEFNDLMWVWTGG